MSEFTLMPAIGISATGLDAESRRMEVIANNMANAQTTHGEDGKVFQRKEVIFAARLSDAIGVGGKENKLQGVELQKIVADERPPKIVYRPGHPEADENGFVTIAQCQPARRDGRHDERDPVVRGESCGSPNVEDHGKPGPGYIEIEWIEAEALSKQS